MSTTISNLTVHSKDNIFLRNFLFESKLETVKPRMWSTETPIILEMVVSSESMSTKDGSFSVSIVKETSIIDVDSKVGV